MLVNIDLQTSQQLLASMKTTLTSKLNSLCVEEKRELKNIKTRPYLHDCLNACALTQHICDHLCQCKFELDHLLHDYHQTINGKLHIQLRSSEAHSAPNPLSAYTQYNSLCDKLRGHISSGSGPQQAMIPTEISYVGLFSLDVDDEIWRDVGLEDGEDIGSTPAWLGNDEVFQGINNVFTFIYPYFL
ncbi:hypothetical protein PAXRUDRAFT_154694 [Paxillus rubicundulus Ve08.2h10]|uniref:Uncharacterized protein n=1 Tax=Paxillus rubicundulus Ve08.2h10 TaxID=930991 RepID=A0A0D0DCS9_9AGAM|nr:hypothetical protein PAXRUDRAFT_154694 [Paxillus rubicundulus Ve08.2h10]